MAIMVLKIMTKSIFIHAVNPFVPDLTFPCPLKTSENRKAL